MALLKGVMKVDMKQEKRSVPFSDKDKRRMETLMTIARSALYEAERLKNQALYEKEEIIGSTKKEIVSITISSTAADWVQYNYDDGSSDCSDNDAQMSCTGECPC